jgi:hypothetical protein
MAADETMLYVTGPVDITDSTIRVGVDGNSSALNIGDTITLINSDGGLTSDHDGTQAQGIQGIANIYTFDLSTLDDKFLFATAAGVKANEQTKALSEGKLAALAFVNQGADLILGPGMYGALLATQRQNLALAPFFAMSGGTSRYDTGSHIDVDGFSMLAGLGWRAPLESGSLVTGAFFEAGWGNYDSYNNFNSAASVKGKGDTEYYGGGILGRLEIPAGPGGVYGEASLRAGHSKTDFRTKDILNSDSDTTSYDSGSAYYGAHFGAGYIWKINDQASLDFSSKYIWTHQDSDSVTISGDEIKFKDMDSQRWRSGARFAYAVNECIAPYAGAYYEPEFGGKAKSTINGDSIKAPELTGGTGIGELGFTLTPAKTLPLSFDLGVQGYTGQREGVTGSLRVKYEF